MDIVKMAHKPGNCDLRCGDAVQSAFLLHSRYGAMKKAVEVGVRIVKDGNWAFAQYLSPVDARHALESCLAEIVRKQQRTGMWFRKNAEALTYPILRGLKNAGLLPEILEQGILCYDPYQRFSAAPDEWGFLVRRNVMGISLDSDGSLRDRLLLLYKKSQTVDGSWEGTVSGTALMVERLLEFGLEIEDISLVRSAKWLLSRFEDAIERKRPGARWGVIVNDIFTTSDSYAEFLSAGRILSHHKLAASCFVTIPIIQTALALRTLVRLGHEGDPLVHRAFISLLAIQTKAKDFGVDLGDVPLGFWCAHQCRFKLEEKEKARRLA